MRYDVSTQPKGVPVVNNVQIRAGRALLGWSQTTLAERAGVSLITVKRLEATAEPFQARYDTVVKVRDALQMAGVEFLDDPGSVGYGVLLRDASQPQRAEPGSVRPSSSAELPVTGPHASTLPDSQLGRRLRRHRAAIIDTAARRNAHNVRVFGSVARGDDSDTSDIDLLVDLDDDVGLVQLIGLERALSQLLRVRVDVVPAASVKPAIRDRVLAEAIPL